MQNGDWFFVGMLLGAWVMWVVIDQLTRKARREGSVDDYLACDVCGNHVEDGEAYYIDNDTKRVCWECAEACPVCGSDDYSDASAYCPICESEIHVCPDCETPWRDTDSDLCPECGWGDLDLTEAVEPLMFIGVTEDRPRPKRTDLYFASVYGVDRCYGGAEEGGWWYDFWTLLQTVALRDEAEFESMKATLLSLPKYAQPDHDRFSMANEHEEYVVLLETEAELGSSATTERPHYE